MTDDEKWPELKRILANEGPAGLHNAIAAEADDSARHALYRLAIGKLGGGIGATAADLDLMVELGDASIADALRMAAVKPGEAARWEEVANVNAYNLSANLCDCWGDGDSRERRHFETGLRYADQAVDLRLKWNKGHEALGMAHWARGKHLMSLARPSEAVAAFREAVASEERGENQATLLNAQAFLGLALERAGDPKGARMREEAMAALPACPDAEVFLEQIRQSMGRPR